jgi:hypothetical protein
LEGDGVGFASNTLQIIQKAMKAAQHGNSHLRLQIMNRSGVKRVLSVRPDEHYWPTWALKAGEDGQGSVSYPFK